MEKVNELCGFIGGIKILEFILESNRLGTIHEYRQHSLCQRFL